MGAFRRHLLLATMAGLVMVAGAAAQDLERGTTQPERGLRIDKSGHPYRPWDLTIGTGFQFDDDTEAWVPRDFSYDGWDGAWGLQADVGHYWTSHLKTEASAALLTNREQYGYENLTIQGRPAQAPWFAEARRGYVSGALTWQFLDNAFAHPFVSAGVRANVVDIRRQRQGSAWSWTGGPSMSFPIEPIDERETLWQVRPYVAAGYKSYFYNERTFLRSEATLGFAPHGVAMWGLRLGIGLDF